MPKRKMSGKKSKFVLRSPLVSTSERKYVLSLLSLHYLGSLKSLNQLQVHLAGVPGGGGAGSAEYLQPDHLPGQLGQELPLLDNLSL